ncbi:MAG: adenylate kinase [Methanobacterium sp.]|nr:adenylate kinase [Methanobacterium sp.]
MVLWNLAAVVGVPGVGKTSLCHHAAKSLGYKHINYGELMLQLAKKKGVASTLEDMFQLPLDLQHDIWRKAASLVEDQEDVILDLHGIDRSSKGYLISLPLEILSPQIIILIEASCDNIIQRRNQDPIKPRPNENIASIKEYMMLLRISMVNCAALMGCSLVILENDDFNKTLDKMKTYL